MTPCVLVACPTYNEKSYCLEDWLGCCRAFTYPHYGLYCVDTTPGSLIYLHHLRYFGIPADHVEPMSYIWDTMELAWRMIVDFAHEHHYTHIASIEADVLCPPETLDVLLEASHSEIVAHRVPYPGTPDGYFALGCKLIPTELLYQRRRCWETHMENLAQESVQLDGRLHIIHRK